jgi:hypothetical protein
MKRNLCFALLTLSLVAGTSQASGFVNGGFETGDASGWTVGAGYRGGTTNSLLTPDQILPGGSLFDSSLSHSQIISAGTLDPNLGALLGSTVNSGNFSYRVEDTINGGYASVISQKVTNYTDSTIGFAWKAVLENGGHIPDESAAMIITLTDNTTGTLLISRLYNAGATGTGVDSRFAQEGDLYYTPTWQNESLSISASLSGHDFTLSVLGADCLPTGHTGYVYLDGFGTAVSAVPESSTYAMLLGGLGLVGCIARRRKTRD